MKPIDAFTSAYIECALWSSTHDDDLNTPLDQVEAEISPDELESIQYDCDKFREMAGDLLFGWTHQQAGHDFWLTRNRHGAGFWDRGFENGHALTVIAQQFPELNLYIGDDGMIHGF